MDVGLGVMPSPPRVQSGNVSLEGILKDLSPEQREAIRRVFEQEVAASTRTHIELSQRITQVIAGHTQLKKEYDELVKATEEAFQKAPLPCQCKEYMANLEELNRKYVEIEAREKQLREDLDKRNKQANLQEQDVGQLQQESGALRDDTQKLLAELEQLKKINRVREEQLLKLSAQIAQNHEAVNRALNPNVPLYMQTKTRWEMLTDTLLIPVYISLWAGYRVSYAVLMAIGNDVDACEEKYNKLKGRK